MTKSQNTQPILDENIGDIVQLEDLLCSIVIDNTAQKSENLFEILKRLILSEKLPAGYQFPNENIFCEKLNVSRSSLREAYVKLETVNLVSRSRAGTRVNEPEMMVKGTLFDTTLQKSELYELLEYRSALESEMCALAAMRISDDELYVLKVMLKNMKANKENIAMLTHFDTQFHFVIAETSRNSLLRQSLEMVSKKYKELVFQAFRESEQLANNAIRYHTLIFDALNDRAPIRAREVMKEHMSDVSKYIEKQ